MPKKKKTNIINVVIVFPRGDAKVCIAPYLECISYIFFTAHRPIVKKCIHRNMYTRISDFYFFYSWAILGVSKR